MKKTLVCMLIMTMTMGSMVTPVFADGEGDATHILCTDSSGRHLLDWFRSNICKRKKLESK